MRRYAGFLWIVGLSGLLGPGCASIPTLDDIILRPKSELTTTPADLGYEYETVTLPVSSAEGRSISIWHVRSAESKALVVVMPGSTDNKSRYVVALPFLIPNGYDAILVDYEGYGESPGTASLSHVIDDAFTVTDYALAAHDTVVLFGISLGTPAATRVAAERDVAGLALEGSLILEDEPRLWLEDNGLGFLPGLWRLAGLYVNPQVPEDFEILDYIGLVSAPKLIMHSVDDEVTPYAGGVRVFQAATEPKELWAMRGPHGLMYEVDPDAYRAHVVGWLDEVVAGTIAATPP